MRHIVNLGPVLSGHGVRPPAVDAARVLVPLVSVHRVPQPLVVFLLEIGASNAWAVVEGIVVIGIKTHHIELVRNAIRCFSGSNFYYKDLNGAGGRGFCFYLKLRPFLFGPLTLQFNSVEIILSTTVSFKPHPTSAKEVMEVGNFSPRN